LPSSAPTNLTIATLAAEQVLCLPIYVELDSKAIQRIIEIIEKRI
jgi:dTDP-4-amino-4,6-dideoxygalactose transaminase